MFFKLDFNWHCILIFEYFKVVVDKIENKGLYFKRERPCYIIFLNFNIF